MVEPCIAEITRLVDSALALLDNHGQGFDRANVQRVRTEIWPVIVDAVNSCPNFSAPERGWLKYLIYDRFDRIRLQGGKPTAINVGSLVSQLPTATKQGNPPKVITRTVLPDIVPY